MITVVSSNAGERATLAALCATRSLVAVECDSVRTFGRSLRHGRPRVVLTRHRLADNYSDDVIAILRAAEFPVPARVVVLMDAAASSAQEARQVALGADLVHRDPVRIEVLLEYLAKYHDAAPASATAAAGPNERESFTFLGGVVQSMDRTIHYRGRMAALSPRQVELAEVLASAPDQVVTYTTLYSDILDRKFRGDTSNMRVLLGKLAEALLPVGLHLRRHVEVIPKTGYRYRPAPVASKS